MTRIDPMDFTRAYLGGSQLGTQQGQIAYEQQQQALRQQQEQEQLARTRAILKTIVQQTKAQPMPGMAPPGGVGPMAQDGGGFMPIIDRSNQEADTLMSMIDTAGPDSLKYIASIVDDQKKRADALANARHAYEQGIAPFVDAEKHPGDAAFMQQYAAEQDPERKMKLWDSRMKAQAEQQQWQSRHDTEMADRVVMQNLMQSGREGLATLSQGFKDKQFKDKVAQVSEAFQRTRGWSKQKADDHAFLVLSNAENEPPSLSNNTRRATTEIEIGASKYTVPKGDGTAPPPEVVRQFTELVTRFAGVKRETGGWFSAGDTDAEYQSKVLDEVNNNLLKAGWGPIGSNQQDSTMAPTSASSGAPVVPGANLSPKMRMTMDMRDSQGRSLLGATNPPPEAVMQAALKELGPNATFEQIDKWMSDHGL